MLYRTLIVSGCIVSVCGASCCSMCIYIVMHISPANCIGAICSKCVPIISSVSDSRFEVDSCYLDGGRDFDCSLWYFGFLNISVVSCVNSGSYSSPSNSIAGCCLALSLCFCFLFLACLSHF